MMKKNVLWVTALSITLALAGESCQRNPLKVDLSDKRATISIDRLDQDIFEVTNDNLKEKSRLLQQKYGSAFDAYNHEVISIGSPADSLYGFYLQTFLTDTVILQAKNAVDQKFADLKPLEKELGSAFSYYKYHFPQKTVPHIFTYISGFNQSMIMLPDQLGIGLDNYLGADFPLYTGLGLPEYKRATMLPEKVATDALYAWAITEFPHQAEHENLLADMIYYGKVLYFLDAMFPDGRDELKIGFSDEKLGWCKKNEGAMWTYLVENRLLYQSERMTIVRFINPAPFTSVFSNQSPGRTGIWLGWQIVRKFMTKNPDVSLLQLMTNSDYQKILNQSGYSPK